MERSTYTEPTVMWRLRRNNQTAHAMVVPHKMQTTLLWWIDERIDGAEDFVEWDGALARADVVRARFLKDEWTDALRSDST
jgi:hypothetical protein